MKQFDTNHRLDENEKQKRLLKAQLIMETPYKTKGQWLQSLGEFLIAMFTFASMFALYGLMVILF